jgi:hypothetical protein
MLDNVSTLAACRPIAIVGRTQACVCAAFVLLPRRSQAAVDSLLLNSGLITRVQVRYIHVGFRSQSTAEVRVGLFVITVTYSVSSAFLNDTCFNSDNKSKLHDRPVVYRIIYEDLLQKCVYYWRVICVCALHLLPLCVLSTVKLSTSQPQNSGLKAFIIDISGRSFISILHNIWQMYHNYATLNCPAWLVN